MSPQVSQTWVVDIVLGGVGVDLVRSMKNSETPFLTSSNSDMES